MTHLLFYCREAILARGLEQVLRQAGGFQLLPLCSELPALKKEVARSQPELLLLDLGPELTFAVLAEIKQAANAKIVLWVNSVSTELAFQAMGLGVRGILRKTLSPDLQVKCLQQVQAGEAWFERSLLDDLAARRRVPLTRRERQLVVLLSQGLKNKEISTYLAVSENTVKVSISRLFQKVGAKNRFELALFGLKNLQTETQAEQKGTAEAAPQPALSPATQSV